MITASLGKSWTSSASRTRQVVTAVGGELGQGEGRKGAGVAAWGVGHDA